MAGRVGMNKGDPGIFGAITGAIGGLVTGGPIGAIAGGLAGLKSGGGGGGRSLTQAPTSRPPINLPGFGPRGAGVNTPAGRLSAFEQNGGQGAKAPAGYHWNKSGYFLKSGEYVPEGTKLVKNRRRNPANPRALSRSISRINSAKRLQSKLRELETGRYTKAGKKKSCG